MKQQVIITTLTAIAALFFMACGVNGGPSLVANKSTATLAVSLSGTAGGVTATWNPYPNATSYNLYCSTSASVSLNSLVYTNVTSPFTVGGLANGAVEYCALTAVINTVEGHLSSAAHATTFTYPASLSGVLNTSLSAGFSVISGIATDAYGNLYVHGETHANEVTGTGISVGDIDGYLTKYNANGVKVWTRQFGIPSLDVTSGFVKVAADGSIYIDGSTSGNLQSGTGASIGTQDAYVAKYDTNGNLLWLKEIGVPSAYIEAGAIAVDEYDNLYLAGTTEGALASGGMIGIQDAFILKLNSSGTTQFVRQLGATGEQELGRGVAVSPDGSTVFLSGDASGNLATQTGAGTGADNLFIARFDSSGNQIWIYQSTFASGSHVDSSSVAYDAVNNRLFTGGDTSIQLSNPSSPSVGNSDAYVARHDPASGAILASYQVGATINHVTFVNDLAVSPIDGSVLAGGQTSGNVLTQSGSSIGTGDAFSLKLDSACSLQWIKELGAPGSNGTDGYAVAFDAVGNALLAGDAQAALTSPYAVYPNNSGVVVEWSAAGSQH